MRNTIPNRKSKIYEPRADQVARVKEAKEILNEIFSNEDHPRYFNTDSELKELVGLSEPIIRKVRKTLGILQRDERIYQYLLPHGPGAMFLDEMVLKLDGRVDYHCLYHILKKRGVDYPRRNK